MHRIPAVTVDAHPSRPSVLARALTGWAILCLCVGLSITFTRVVDTWTALDPLAIRAAQAILTAAMVVPLMMLLHRRLENRSSRDRDSSPSAWAEASPAAWTRAAALGIAVGLCTAVLTWGPAFWAGWIRFGGVSTTQLLIFLVVNTLIVLAYEAVPEELALRGYAWDALRQRLGPFVSAAGVTILFCATYTGISAVQTSSALMLGVRADGISVSPGDDPIVYLVQISLFGLTLITARSLPLRGGLAAAITFHLVHLTANRLLFGGLGGFDTGLDVTFVAPDAVGLVLVHIALSGVVFLGLRKTLKSRRSGGSPGQAGQSTTADR